MVLYDFHYTPIREKYNEPYRRFFSALRSGIHWTTERSALRLQQTEGGAPARERVCGMEAEYTGVRVPLAAPSGNEHPSASIERRNEAHSSRKRTRDAQRRGDAFAVREQNTLECASISGTFRNRTAFRLPSDGRTERIQAVTERRRSTGTRRQRRGDMFAVREQSIQEWRYVSSSLKARTSFRHPSDGKKERVQDATERKGRTGAGTCLRYGNRAYGSGVTSAAPYGHERRSGIHRTTKRSAFRPQQSGGGAPAQEDSGAGTCLRYGNRAYGKALRQQPPQGTNTLQASTGRRNEARSGRNRAKARTITETCLQYENRAYGSARSIGGTFRARTAFQLPSDGRTEGVQDATERRGHTARDMRDGKMTRDTRGTGTCLRYGIRAYRNGVTSAAPSRREHPSGIHRTAKRNALRLQQSEGGAPTRAKGCTPAKEDTGAVTRLQYGSRAYRNGVTSLAPSRREHPSGIHRTAERSPLRPQQSEGGAPTRGRACGMEAEYTGVALRQWHP